jgi:hypothetical protein
MVSVYFAVSAAIVTAGFGLVSSDKSVTLFLLWASRVIGLVVTVVFFVYEWRLEKLIRYDQIKARTLEALLQFDMMQERPTSVLMFGATWALYGVFALFWILSLVLFYKV